MVGALVRRNGGIMLVHPPDGGAWTFPRGPLVGSESAEEGALRVVRDQTGWRCEAGRRLEQAGEIEWWELWARERDAWEPNDAVDDVAWVPLSEVESLLSEERDRRLAALARERK